MRWIPGVLALLMLGCVTAAPPPTDPFGRSLHQRDTDVYDPSADYATLRRYDQQERDADSSVLAAARRVLGGIRFQEITQAELERRLGKPIDAYGRDGSHMVEFLYQGKDDSVAARFELYQDREGVIRVFQLEGTSGVRGFAPAPDDDEEEQ